MKAERLYFKISKVQNREYLQVWDRETNECVHIGSPKKVLNLVGVSFVPPLVETKLTKKEENRLIIDSEGIRGLTKNE